MEEIGVRSECARVCAETDRQIDRRTERSRGENMFYQLTLHLYVRAEVSFMEIPGDPVKGWL